MHAARITSWGSTPQYVELPTPAPVDNEIPIKIVATGLHQVVRTRATGKHYSATTLPHYPGVDGVGTTPEGKFVYFSSFGPGGTFAEWINRPPEMLRPVPEGLDPVQVAAMVNPAMSGWMALRTRTEGLPEGFSVLIVGVTSASGGLAVGLAKRLGAGRVVGAARNEGLLKRMVGQGLDGYVVLEEDADRTDWGGLGHVDVVLDYVYGEQTAKLLEKMKPTGRVQYVQIGGLGEGDLRLSAAALRGKDLVMRGSGPGAWSMQGRGREMEGLLEALKSTGGLKVKVFNLEEVENRWNERSSERVVFVP
ncbi:MAG: hypothetical protein Q9190_002094 [Brigantiaea leucoxantha]